MVKPAINAARKIMIEIIFHFVDFKVWKTSARQRRINTPATGKMAMVVKWLAESLGILIAMNNPKPKVKL